jgi:hypothetical protein
MKGYSLALAATLLLVLVGDHVIFAQNPPCDPDRDRRNPNLQAAKEAKKAELRRAGYPERFMKLIDREECIACVRQASDAFHIMIVYKDNDYAPIDAKTGRHWTHVSTSWDPQSELIAREKTKDGTIEGYYISNTLQRNCHCCPEIDKDMVTPQDYSDWNEDLQANTSHLIPFDQSNTTGPPPDDLINPASQWIDDPVPNIETFQKPARKQVSTPCPQCAGDALKLNDAYRALDELWDQKISLLNEQSILENTEATRSNELNLLHYKQRSALTRIPDGDKKIEEAEKAQEADQATMRGNVLELELIDARLTVLEPRIEQMKKALIACAEQCKRTTIAEQPPTPAGRASAPNPLVTGTTPNPPTPGTSSPPPPRGTNPPPGTSGATCPNCQALADLLAALNARHQQMLDEIEDYQSRIKIEGDENAQRQRDLDRMIAGGPGTFDRYAADRLRTQIVNVGNRLFQWQKNLDLLGRLVDEVNEQIASVSAWLATCNAACLTPIDGNIPPPTDIGMNVMCPACIAIAEALQSQLRRIGALERDMAACQAEIERLNAEYRAHGGSGDVALITRLEDLEAIQYRTGERLRINHEIAETYRRHLEACNASCKTPTVTDGGGSTPSGPPSIIEQPTLPREEVFTGPPPSARTEPAPAEAPKIDTARWVENWTNCLVSNTCPPIDTDGGVPGNSPYPGGLPYVNLTDGNPWITSGNVRVEISIQIKMVDVIDPWSYPDYSRLMTVSQNRSSNGVWPTLPSDAQQIWVPPTLRQGVEKWFNPLGLLARRLADQMERWRGSLGPRPLIRTSDLELIDRVSNVQAAGFPAGVHVLLTDQGGSTGKTLAMQILNLTGAPVALSSRSFAVQPIQQQAQKQVMQAFSRLSQAAPVRLDLAAYCVEFLKAPPGPSTLLRLAPPDIQQKYSSMSKVLQSAYRVSKANALHPDSNPAAYTDAMKQWAVWTVEQNFNEARFTEAFLGHTKKNVEAAKQQWSKQAEAMIRQASPNRWRDVVKILQGAGVPVPR